MSISLEKLHLQHFDPDVLLHVLNGMNMEHRLLARGALSARLDRLMVGGLSITVGKYSFPVLGCGETPRDGKVYLGLLGRTGEVSVNRQAVSLDQLVLYAPGSEIHYHTRSASNWYMLHFPLERLQEVTAVHQAADLQWPREGVRYVDLSSAVARRLRKELRALLHFGEILSGVSDTNVTGSFAYEGMMRLLAETIVQSPYTPRTTLSIGRRRALNALEASIDRWMENPDSRFRVSGIENINQRLLERASREVYGVTPHRWLKLARLNAAYRDLYSSDKSVTDVCTRWGFGNMGRFAGEYRALFGESPRETLQRV